MTETQLFDHFSKFGILNTVQVKFDDKGHTKGFGFVNFISPGDAWTAYNAGYLLPHGKSQHSIGGIVFHCVLQEDKIKVSFFNITCSI